jgi:hypothetical protein
VDTDSPTITRAVAAGATVRRAYLPEEKARKPGSYIKSVWLNKCLFARRASDFPPPGGSKDIHDLSRSANGLRR